MNIDPSSVKKILVIRFRSIGDILLSNPTLEALRQKFPSAKIDMLVDDIFECLLENNPNVDNVITHDRKKDKGKLVADLSFIRDIRKKRYDLVVDLQGAPRGAWLTYLSKATYRAGHPFRLRNRIAYNVNGSHPKANDHSWVVQFLATSGLGLTPPKSPNFYLYVDPVVKTSMIERLKSYGLSFDRPLVLLHPGARVDYKRWPAEKMGRLARWLVDEKNSAVVLAGGPQDVEEVAKIRTASGYALPSSTKLSIKELIALIDVADYMVCNDSGPMHIAGVLDKPTVALFGPSDPTIWAPMGSSKITLSGEKMECMPCDQKGCPYIGNHCMTKIDLDNVKQALSWIF